MSDVVTLTLLTEVFVTLFVIMDPVGTIPIFLSLTRGRSPRTMKRAAWQAVAVSFGVITVFAFFGQGILSYLHISLPALQGAGGLLLLLDHLEPRWRHPLFATFETIVLEADLDPRWSPGTEPQDLYGSQGVLLPRAVGPDLSNLHRRPPRLDQLTPRLPP